MVLVQGSDAQLSLAYLVSFRHQLRTETSLSLQHVVVSKLGTLCQKARWEALVGQLELPFQAGVFSLECVELGVQLL